MFTARGADVDRITYDTSVAAALVRENLISRLTGEPWRETPVASDAEKRGGPHRGKGRKT